jgi:hypothetical protein
MSINKNPNTFFEEKKRVPRPVKVNVTIPNESQRRRLPESEERGIHLVHVRVLVCVCVRERHLDDVRQSEVECVCVRVCLIADNIRKK